MPRSLALTALFLLTALLCGCNTVHFQQALGRADDPALKRLLGTWRYVGPPIDPKPVEGPIEIVAEQGSYLARDPAQPKDQASLRYFAGKQGRYLVVELGEGKAEAKAYAVFKLEGEPPAVRVLPVDLAQAIPLLREAGFKVEEKREQFFHYATAQGERQALERFVSSHDARLFAPRQAMHFERVNTPEAKR
ncbi:hypothetical protein [Chitinimonas lacunae]|uniref:Uncharacterized protein n=1 Tax=Chitinimonas lacunae TaxID=1963018 RepID=A0ABV8MME2_9NEIS